MIKKYQLLVFFAIIYIFWLFLFFIERLLFLVYYHKLFASLPLSSICNAFYSGIRLDLSTAGYLMTLPVLTLFIRWFLTERIYIKILVAVLLVETATLAIIHAAELSAYSEWGHKLSSRVFMHLLNPSEVLRTTGIAKGLSSALLILFEFGLGFFVIRAIKKKVFVNENRPKGVCFVILNCFGLIVGVMISFLFMRGGLQQIPINIDSAYFSTQPVLNDLSVNSGYYFGNSFFLFNKSDIASHVNPTLSASDQRLVDAYYTQFPSDSLLLNTSTPNIVFIIFEGWSAHGVGAISAQKTATPFFDKLSKEGVLFTHMFAANTTSEIGNATIFSGFTGVPENPLPLFLEKHRHINTLSDELKRKGYSTSYLFSGDLKYGNIKGFLTEHSFDRLKDELDFNQSLPKGKLNYYDRDLYKKFLSEIRRNTSPFLACAFTGSTHFPYDCPMKKHPFKGEEAEYLNSMVYADDCLREFFEEAKRAPWYKNTLFVLVSDHGHNSPVAASPYLTETFRIPCLLVGPALKQGAQSLIIDKACSQGDLAASLADQLNLSLNEFPFSRNMFSSQTQDGAFISTIRGFGFASRKGGHMYNFDAKQVVFESYQDQNTSTKNRRLANACLSKIYGYFNGLDAIK